jgi:hypothetical protein
MKDYMIVANCLRRPELWPMRYTTFGLAGVLLQVAEPMKIAAEREGDKIRIEKANGDAGSWQFFCRSLSDVVFVGGKCKEAKKRLLTLRRMKF